MKEKKEKKRWGLILFLVVIMLGTSFSVVLYYGFQGQSQSAKYNGIKFVSNGNFWIAEIEGRQAAFTFLPADVENIPAANDFSKVLQGKYEMDSTSESNSTFRESIAQAQYQMELTLEVYNIYLRKGFTANSTFTKIPIITCANATQNVPVIYFSKSNSTNINLKGNCIVAEALTNTDVIRVKDRLLYGLLGVMK